MTDTGADAGTPVLIEAGDLTAVFAGGDLFDVRWAGVEVIQRLYVAVRDEVWNTIPARIATVSVREDRDSVLIDFEASHDHEELSYTWRGQLRALSSGRLEVEMRGTALREFAYSKIGFNIHHGVGAHAGRRFRCRTLDGPWEGTFGEDLVPQLVRDGTLTAMTPHFDRLELDLGDVQVTMEFEGDRFEMQDHRNWIDANWKTYGTPLELGFPMTVHAGEQRFQRITVAVSGAPPPVPGADEVVIAIDESVVAGALPEVGHLLTSAPTGAELSRLLRLEPDHIRLDLHPDTDLVQVIPRAVELAGALGSRLEVGLHVRLEELAADARAAAEVLAALTVPVARLIVLAEVSGFSAFRGACPPEAGEAVRRAFESTGAAAPRIVSGTGQSFADINRDRPDYARLDGLAFSVNPQVHASDDRSLMQNARVIADVVEFARRLYPGADVALSPVELIGAAGPYPAGPARDGASPPNVDPRQRERFCAAWTVAALAQLARCAATSATFYELAGPRGLIAAEGQLFPVGELFAQLAPLRRHPLVGVRIDGGEQVAALAFDRGEALAVVVANCSAEPCVVRLPDGARRELSAYEVTRFDLAPSGATHL
jgi:hypothetical protein